jgi:amino acid transporter
LAAFALAIAYIVSVAFYLRLLSAFVLHRAGPNVELLANLVTTAILIFIGLTGYLRGLRALERLEVYSVTIKLAIIVGLLIGLAMFDTHSVGDLLTRAIPVEDYDGLEKLRLLAGLLLVVQGFETSRYLGSKYDADTRVKTMRLAQILSGLIYIVFVILALPLLTYLNTPHPSETAIIDLAGLVSPVLPALLVVAAVMSQFSAAVPTPLEAAAS